MTQKIHDMYDIQYIRWLADTIEGRFFALGGITQKLNKAEKEGRPIEYLTKERDTIYNAFKKATKKASKILKDDTLLPAHYDTHLRLYALKLNFIAYGGD